MNKSEYYNSKNTRNSYYKQVHKLLKYWKIENNIPTNKKCVVHHRDDTEETCAKMSAARMGKNNPNYGKKLSDETKAKISTIKKAINMLWNVYKTNGGTLSSTEFRKALKNGEITFETQPITIFIK